MSDALRPIVGNWIKKIQLAYDFKKAEFQNDADECMRFFDGPYDFLYDGWRKGGSRGFDWGGDSDQAFPAPSARVTVNKTAELVQLFGPALYHRNPVRKVIPRKVIEPMPELYGDIQNDPYAFQAYQQQAQAAQQQMLSDALRADMLEKYLNYTPHALGFKNEARNAIDEALIKGMGCLWTRPYQPEGATMKWSGSFFDSVDNLLLDPDAMDWRDMKWIARRHCRPVWQVERQYRLPEGALSGRGHLESYSQQAVISSDVDGDWRRKQGRTADLLVYWEVFSKMGLGGRLSGVATEDRDRFDGVGDYCYLVLTDSLPYPLNLPPPLCDMLVSTQPLDQPGLGMGMGGTPDAMQAIRTQLEWPTPFWAEDDWPVTPLVFHKRPGKLWPMSHMKPALGELKFLNWAWSFLANKVKIASRDFLAIAKSAGQEIKEQIKHGADYTVVEVENIHGSIDKVVQFLQHPTFNPEIYKVIEGVTLNFERRVGLTELVYGLSNRQIRSAQEANIKADAVSVRPDEMANQIEDALTDVARKEAFVARWHLLGSDVKRVLGDMGAQIWDAIVVPADPGEIMHQLEYQIEANSARKPNKAADQEKMQTAMQNLFQPLMQYAMTTGQLAPLNALVSDWAKSLDIDPKKYLFEPPVQQPMAPAEPPQPEGPPQEGGQ